jgi:Mg-chelatase subunit ChlD
MSRRSRTPRLCSWLLCSLAAHLCALAAAAAEPASPTVRILIESPQPGEPVRNEVHQAPIRGNALAEGERPAEYDVMIVLDISGSTKAASGVDVDRDGEVGINPNFELLPPGTYPEGTLSSDPGDTILAAEVAAADALIASLPQGGRVRIGIVSFSGEMNPDTGRRKRFDQQDGWVEVPLTDNFAAARARLPSILARGPYGGTNFAAGLRVAIVELAGLGGARSVPRAEAKKVILFLTDGLPTFPIGSGSTADPGDNEAALTAARLAHSAGITINTYALGPSALNNPFAATEIARITRGTFMPVQNPGDIVSFLQGTSFANVDDVVFTNLTTREVSYDIELLPDGSFSGFVPVREGTNRVRVTALASNGSSGSVDLDLVFETAGLSQRALALELERIRERNKQLMLLIERERIQRFREHQRKQLELEVSPEGADE